MIGLLSLFTGAGVNRKSHPKAVGRWIGCTDRMCPRSLWQENPIDDFQSLLILHKHDCVKRGLLSKCIWSWHMLTGSSNPKVVGLVIELTVCMWYTLALVKHEVNSCILARWNEEHLSPRLLLKKIIELEVVLQFQWNDPEILDFSLKNEMTFQHKISLPLVKLVPFQVNELADYSSFPTWIVKFTDCVEVLHGFAMATMVQRLLYACSKFALTHCGLLKPYGNSVQMMVCCLTSLSHCLNQCWLHKHMRLKVQAKQTIMHLHKSQKCEPFVLISELPKS